MYSYIQGSLSNHYINQVCYTFHNFTLSKVQELEPIIVNVTPVIVPNGYDVPMYLYDVLEGDMEVLMYITE